MYIYIYIYIFIFICIYTYIYITHSNALQHTLLYSERDISSNSLRHASPLALQHTTKHCNTLCNTLQLTSFALLIVALARSLCNTLQHIVIYPVTLYNTLPFTCAMPHWPARARSRLLCSSLAHWELATLCNMLQLAATRCNTL